MTPRRKFDLAMLPERPNFQFETELWQGGISYVAGIDEAGRGALAGPVAAGAVVFPCQQTSLYDLLSEVRDSKEMTADGRTYWASVIKQKAVSWGVGFSSPDEIDRMGIVPATCLAAERALAHLTCIVEHVLVDYLRLNNINICQTPLVKGDARSLSIASAAILAKTTRDALMIALDAEYPGYFFDSNKGYASLGHRQAINKLGPCTHHRCSFAPVSEYFSLFPPEL